MIDDQEAGSTLKFGADLQPQRCENQMMRTRLTDLSKKIDD